MNKNFINDKIFSKNENSDKNFLKLENFKISFKDFFLYSNKISNLFKNLSIKPDQRILAQTEKSVTSLAIFVASLRIGAVFIPLNTSYTAFELEYFIEDSLPSLLIIDDQREQELKNFLESKEIKSLTLNDDETGTLTELITDISENLILVERQKNDLASILYTSGTTGKSKGAMLSHNNLVSNTTILSKYWAFSQDDILLHALPIYHIHGLFVACNICLYIGSEIIFLKKFDVEEVIKKLKNSTVMMGVPTFYTRLLENDKFNSKVTQEMRLFISGSAPLLSQTHNEFEKITGHKILERYGMSETNMNASNPYLGERKPGTVGVPLENVTIKITNVKTGVKLKNGQIGMIQIKGENVFLGYWRNIEETKKSFSQDGFFITGDLGKITDDGYLTIVGRDKDLIISGGLNIYPKEIEILIDNIEGVNESAVIGVPHNDFGEAVIAIIVKNELKILSEETIVKYLKLKLANFKRPKKVFFVNHLPRNTMGKVQKLALRNIYNDLFKKTN